MKQHPLEEAFELETIEYEDEKEIVEVEVPKTLSPSYDEKDNAIDNEFDVIYTKALSAYASMAEELEFVEGKYKARVGEVSAQFLNTALNASKEKSSFKQHKDKLVVKEANNTTNNNLFVGNYEDVMKVIRDAREVRDESSA